MKNVRNILFAALISLVSVNFHTISSRPSGYQILCAKHRLQENLQSSVFDEARFQECYNQYCTSFSQRDPIIEQALKEFFEAVMTKKLERRKQVQATREERVFTGIRLCGFGLAAGASGVWFLNEILKSPYSTGDDAMLPSVLLSAAMCLGAVGIKEISEVLNDDQAELNIINNEIAILDANYAYAYPTNEKLSVQMSCKNS